MCVYCVYLLSIHAYTVYILKIFTCLYIYIYSFSRHFYPKRLTIEEYNKQYIIKRQTDTGSACNTKFQVLFREDSSQTVRGLGKESKVKERELR